MAAFAGVCLAALTAGSTAVAGKHATSRQTQLAATAPNAVPDTEQAILNNGDSVISIVNDSPISDYDLRQRIALFLATTGVRATPEQMKTIRAQVLAQLETERMEILEAQKNKISVSSAEVDKAIDSIMRDNHLTMDQIKKVLGDGGVDMSTFRSQLAAQIAWTKTVQNEYGDRVKVSEEDVNDELKRLAAGANKPHFRVAEIFEAVDSPEQDPQVLKNMQGLLEQIRLGAPFESVARQFSQNPTAASGGDLGIIQEGQLPPELNGALLKMHAGEVSEPIKASGGYYLLLLRARIEPAGTKVPDAKEVTAAPGMLPLARVLLPIGPKPAKQLLENATQAANVLRDHIAGCSGLKEIIARMKGAMYFDLGNMQLSNLSSQIRDEINKTQPGQTTQPFASPAGIELIVRCDKPAPQIQVFKMPSRDDVEQSLYEEQMAVYARRYLRDLRRTAQIETVEDRAIKHGASAAR
ncbi:MAG TPA: peptidylprolyl isomerase [Rhizomicrobium sp.]|jgi:peptidyl-prolyl cis-trans isomerase SurA|nr:peptidylprolyl isomerase [Rhizomicrobium sp.]